MSEISSSFLGRKYLALKKINPGFSVRAFARKLGMQPGPVNEMLKGQRAITEKTAQKICEKLKLDPFERAEFLKEVTTEKKPRKSADPSIQLKSDEFKLISDWVHFAILSLLKVKDFKSDIQWIAERLGINAATARKAVLRLQHLNLLHVSADGKMSRTPHPIRTTDDVLDLSLQDMHLQDMEMAKVKLKTIELGRRDFTNCTFPANPQGIHRAKEIIRKCQDEVEEAMYDEDSTEVYRICTYLFPLTQ
jgi:uncharacterized protein (TIGR02147 family)